MKPTGIVKDAIFLKHQMGSYHPESPHRLEVIYEMIEQLGSSLNVGEIPIREASETGIELDP